MPPTNLPKRADVGAVIGGCELVRRIGRGGMAEVWVARRALGTKGSKFVAIKLMADHYVGDERYGRMFRAEAELAAVLSHANVVQVFDEGEDDGRSYLVMEWVDGVNLLRLGTALALLDDEPRRLRVIAYIIGQLLHALHYAHSITSPDGEPLAVVHRDVSPQNVLVSNQGEVKLADFGVAHHALEESSGVHVKGKVRYMSPEQLSGCTRAPTVDLYAVGAILHELLDGRRFRGEHEDGQDLFAAVLSGRISPLSRPVPTELDALRLRLLERDPSRRIQTAAQALALLRCYPGYGDAREELATLCASLTGVVKPRAGLVQPPVNGDPPGSRRGNGSRGKPRRLERRSQAHPAARTPIAARRSGPRPMAKGVIQAVEDAPLIGYTEIARLQSRLQRITGVAAAAHAHASAPSSTEPGPAAKPGRPELELEKDGPAGAMDGVPKPRRKTTLRSSAARSATAGPTNPAGAERKSSASPIAMIGGMKRLDGNVSPPAMTNDSSKGANRPGSNAIASPVSDGSRSKPLDGNTNVNSTNSLDERRDGSNRLGSTASAISMIEGSSAKRLDGSGSGTEASAARDSADSSAILPWRKRGTSTDASNASNASNDDSKAASIRAQLPDEELEALASASTSAIVAWPRRNTITRSTTHASGHGSGAIPRWTPTSASTSTSTKSFGSGTSSDASDDPTCAEDELHRPKTVKLERASGFAARAATGDAARAHEPGSGTETESMVHARYRSREGSATETGVCSSHGSQEISASRSRWSSEALVWPGSFRTTPSWRSALKLGLGMVVVAVLSASTARWLGSEPSEAARPTATQESTPVTAELGWQDLVRRHESRRHESQRQETQRQAPAPEADPAREGEGEGESAATPTHPTDRVVPVAPKPARKAKAARKVLMKVRGGMGLDRAQVKVASQTVTVGDLRQVLVTPGRKTLKWRAHARDEWKPGGSWRFRPGTTVVAFVTKDGLRLRTIQ